jgi:predicted nucleotide-binding protein (sugar kinase/HSP70/actin superfamily)
VFAKSDIVSLLNSGASAADAAAGAIYAVAKNYLTLVVGKRPLGRRAAFLGGVARHQTALTAALRALRSDVEFFVPAGGDVCGALGVACLTREACRDGRLSATRFPAGKHATLNLPVAEFDCKSCANVCRVKKWKTGDGATRFSGGTCGRYEDAAAIAKQARNFTEEYLALLRAGEPSAVEKGDACETIGVPRALTYYEQGPLWTSFLSALGFRVVVSQGGPQAAARGALRSVNGSVCLPIKVLLGHAEELEVQGVSRAFFPTVIEGERRDGCLRADACMLVQVAVASFLRASFPKIQWVSPVFHYRGGKWVWREALLSAAAELGRTPAQARQALVVAEAAWAEFAARRRKLGAEFMAAVERGEPCAALLGRAYSFAPESDSGLPRQFARLGIVAAPAAILPFEETEHLDGRHVDLIFKSAQDAVLSSKWVMRRKPNLFPVVLNQFLCRQDAAVLGFVAKIIESRPHLQLTLDENSGEAGFKTRCAAFAQVVAQTLRRPAKAAPSTAPSDPFDPFVPDPKLRRFTGTVWVGGMPGFFKAAFDVIGLKTKIIPDENRAEAIERGRKYFTHGEPCLPFVGLAGTLEQLTENPEFNPQEAMLFLPGTRHCASAALSQMFKDVFAQLGVKGVTIVAPRNGFDIDEATAVFGLNFGRSLVRAMLGEEYLQRLLLTIRPYEVQRGEATEVFKEVHEQFIGSFGKHEEFFFALRRAAERLAAIPVRNVGSRPKILVTGEYVVRTDKFLNDGIHQKIEALGGEALRAPLFADYAELLCRTIHSWQWRAGHYLTAAKETFFSLFRNGDIKRMYALMKPYFKGRLDPDLSRYLASDKIPLPPETDPVMRLELYQALWNLEQGDIAGLVNVAPFGCSISTAVLPILHKTAGSQAPLLSLWFDGQAGAHTDNRLAAFMECVRARQSPATHWAAKRRVSDPAALVRL